MPGELEPVIKQLRTAFTYQSFNLLETAVARGRENGEVGASGHLPTPESDPNMSMRRTYHLNADRVAISPGEKRNIIRFDKWYILPDRHG